MEAVIIGLGAAAGTWGVWFVTNQLATFFQIEGLTLQNLVRAAIRRPAPHVTRHVGEFILFRGNGRGGFHKVPIKIQMKRSSLRFKLVPPNDKDEAITGIVTLHGPHMTFSCPKKPATFSAILWVSNEHIENYFVGVFSGTMVDNAPYSGRAFMVPARERISDAEVMSLLEQDQITIIGQRALAVFAQRVIESRAAIALAQLAPPKELP